MRFIGLDLHKRTVEVCVLAPTGRVLARHSIACERSALTAFATEYLTPTDRLAVEATTNTWAVAKVLKPFVAAVAVGNPLQVKAIAQAEVMTDKIDAEVLANLLRCDFLPEVWEPDPGTQTLRHRTSVRSALVADRTRLKNRIHSVLSVVRRRRSSQSRSIGWSGRLSRGHRWNSSCGLSAGMKMTCTCDAPAACKMMQNMCSMMAGGMCSICCTMNGMTVCCCNLTMGVCKVEATADRCCVI